MRNEYITPLVEIRPWAEGDLTLLERLLGDPVMMEHLGGPETSEQIGRRHQRYRRMSDSDNGQMFAIVVGPERVACGSVGFWEKEWQGQLVWETGWSVLPEFQGQGISTRATVAVVKRAGMKKMHRFIHAFPAVENGASNAVCRKVGFTLLGQAEFEYPPGHVMLCNDWRFDLLADLSESAP